MKIPGMGKAGRWHVRALPLVLLGLLIAAVCWWARPRRVQQWVSADGTHRWAVDGALMGRQMAWVPPQPVAVEELADAISHGERGGQTSTAVLHPALAADGATFYVALRRAAGDWDLYWAERRKEGFSALLPVGAANTPADELSPHISADGQWLYFSSNRVGGEGGFDLYVCRREANGWSAPANLGPAVNSLADELDPALSSNGLVLYFAANRAADGRPLRTTDLYASRRDSADTAWQPAGPLVEANTPANERTPLLCAADGALYFASDRPARPQELVNFDLYRLRPAGGSVRLEPLGAGVNTAANELAPALSPEGTRLWFASDRLGDRRLGAYGLYSSRLVEVEVQSYWDTSRWQALLAVWPQALALSLGLLLLVYLAARLRGWLFERASVGRYVVLSLLLHGLLLFLLAWVPLGTVVVERARQIVASQAPRSADDNLHQSHRAGRHAYEKLADLRSLEHVAAAEVPRQVTERPNLLGDADMPLPALPAAPGKTAVPNLADPRRVLAIEPAPAAPDEDLPALARQQPLAAAAAPADEQIVLPRPAVQPENPPDPNVQLARQPSEIPTPAFQQPEPPLAVQLAETELPAPPAAALLPEQLAPSHPAPRPLYRGPREPAADAVTGEDSLPQLAGQPQQEAPLPIAETALPRAEQALSPPRHELALPRLRIAADRNMGSLSPLELTPGSGPRHVPDRLPPTQQTIVSPAAAAPEEALVVAAKPVPGLAELAPDAAALQVVIEQAALLPSPPAVQTPQAPFAAAPPAGTPSPPMMPYVMHSVPTAPQRATLGTLGVDEQIEPVDLPPLQHVDAELPAVASLPEQPLPGPSQRAAAAQPSPVDPSGPGTPHRPLVVGSLSLTRVETPASLSPLATRLERLPAEALPVAYAEDNVGLRAMFSLRQGDVRREYIELFGGSPETEAAVRRGLAWLAEHQFSDGHWSLHQLDPPEKNLPATPGPGNAVSDTAATGLALLAFLGSGHTHQQGEYQGVVQRGLQWLISRQQPDGNLFAERVGNTWMYSHGIGAIALCEAFGLTQDPDLRGPAQQALQFIVAAQHPGTGGWRYTPGEAGDTSVVGWQVMALKSGEMAGLEVPPATLELARRWLASAAGSAGSLGTFGYTGPGGSLAMTAEGLLCHQFLGCGQDDPQLAAGVRILAANLPQHDRETSYYWYYATQVLYHVQGPAWEAWNQAMRDLAVRTQITQGPLAGTWDPRDQWEQAGGRLYATCLRLLILETYYRHLPLYRPMGP
ncbi:MAG: hypothetical protein K6T86_04480 [Pirellulales bacterium]|nr:hypothetical protein [Pirellulales bacterium]